MSAVLKARKPKRCRTCGEEFVPLRPLQRVCPTLDCVMKFAQAKGEERERKRRRRELLEGRKRLRTLSELTEIAQAAFNSWVRARDEGLPCISCGRFAVETYTGGAWDCGHFRTIGACPELRFEPTNAHRQCKTCNSGVIRAGKRVRVAHDPERAMTIRARYRENLVVRIGLAAVEWLEGPHEAKHYTRERLVEIAAAYRRRTRELRG